MFVHVPITAYYRFTASEQPRSKSYTGYNFNPLRRSWICIQHYVRTFGSSCGRPHSEDKCYPSVTLSEVWAFPVHSKAYFVVRRQFDVALLDTFLRGTSWCLPYWQTTDSRFSRRSSQRSRATPAIVLLLLLSFILKLYQVLKIVLSTRRYHHYM